MNLQARTFSAVRWTTVAMGGKALLQFLQMVILAHLLSPSEFGLMALVLSITMFALLFVDMGVSNAIIHHQDISQDERSSLYWLNVSTGVILSVALMASSPWVSDFYHEPRLKLILLAISPYFLVVALGQQLRVMAEKELNFSRLAVFEVTAALAGFLVMAIVAVSGGGVYALVFGFLANALAFTALVWLYLSGGWRPNLRMRMSEIRKFLSFGAYAIGNNLVNSINSSADIFMGGRMLGTGALGIFSLPRDLALNLAGVVNPIVTRVGLPVMAKSQGNPELLKSVYLKTMQMTSSINFPIYLALFAFAPETVSVLFGSQWQESVPLLRLLALWGLLRSIGNPVGSLIFAVGRADLAFKWNLGWTFLILPLLWFGLHHGALGLTVALLLLGLVGQVPNWLLLVRPLCGAGFVEYFMQIGKPLLAAILATIAGYAAAYAIEGNIVRLVIGCSVGLVAYLVLSYSINRNWLLAMSELLLIKRGRA